MAKRVTETRVAALSKHKTDFTKKIILFEAMDRVKIFDWASTKRYDNLRPA